MQAENEQVGKIISTQEVLQRMMKGDLLGRKVRVVPDAQGNPWFLLRDVATADESVKGVNANSIKRRLDIDEWRHVQLEDGLQRRTFLVVNEPGLYKVLLTMRGPLGREFQRIIFKHCLPPLSKEVSK